MPSTDVWAAISASTLRMWDTPFAREECSREARSPSVRGRNGKSNCRTSSRASEEPEENNEEINGGSLSGFVEFWRLNGARLPRPELTLSATSNLIAQWRHDERHLFLIHFLSEDSVRFVAFYPTRSILRGLLGCLVSVPLAGVLTTAPLRCTRVAQSAVTSVPADDHIVRYCPEKYLSDGRPAMGAFQLRPADEYLSVYWPEYLRRAPLEEMLDAIREFVKTSPYGDLKFSSTGRLAVCLVAPPTREVARTYSNRSVTVTHQPRDELPDKPDPHSGIFRLKHEEDEFAAFLAEIFQRTILRNRLAVHQPQTRTDVSPRWSGRHP